MKRTIKCLRRKRKFDMEVDNLGVFIREYVLCVRKIKEVMGEKYA